MQLALERQPDSQSLLTDLASAYFERAETANRSIDYGNAIECLGKALAKSPDDPVALFNRAITSERLFLYTQAVQDWEHYLRVQPNGEWADDARKQLAAVRQKLQQQQQSRRNRLLEPAEIAEGGIGDATVRAKIDQRIEEYLHVAVTTWLPLAFPVQSPGQPSAREAQTALAVIGAVTLSGHADPWLADLLDGPRGEQFPSAILALYSGFIAHRDIIPVLVFENFQYVGFEVGVGVRRIRKRLTPGFFSIVASQNARSRIFLGYRE